MYKSSYNSESFRSKISERRTERSSLTAFLKIIVAPLILVVPGIIAYNIYGNQISGDIVYPVLVNKLLPSKLSGFFGAVLFGAVLSSFNSALNSASTIFSLNIYKPLFSPNIQKEIL